MAEEKKESKEASEKTVKKSNMLMIIIIAVLVLIIVAGAVVAVLLMSHDGEDVNTKGTHPATEQSASHGSENPAPSKPKISSEDVESRKLSQIGTLYPLETFTVNLKSEDGRRYLKAAISLELDGKELDKELETKTAVLRDRIIRILSSKTLEEISSKKGKQQVSDQIIETLNSMIVDGSIKGIYFTEFVIQ
ncbi:flagellar basal body-associated protein FliL [Sulfurimonas sp.]|uniref:flagellar basal body-associated protein FliL n=1 Tax=Sulfurimonas sp. TaxID=2022749 RepID=UPI0025D33852|nr:flagellar basal body-associated protein FliL [Sulfurimonas sp.]MDD5156805.1 flagellar basal body-associated protein FliL [Sulfurimonas sp.]